MNDNKSAFCSSDYDDRIKQTLPYYEQFYKEIIELVKIFNYNRIRWLDVGCGTGKMASVAYENVDPCDIQNLTYTDEFDVITAIQVTHYLRMDERKIALQKCYEALKDNGLFISFENFAPFTEVGKTVYLEKWRRYQLKQGKSSEECGKHIDRYGKDYFPISLSENMELMRNCGFKAVEILWLSNMQVGIWGIR